jgi:DNA-binding NarL/FixJ family response regulator
MTQQLRTNTQGVGVCEALPALRLGLIRALESAGYRPIIVDPDSVTTQPARLLVWSLGRTDLPTLTIIVAEGHSIVLAISDGTAADAPAPQTLLSLGAAGVIERGCDPRACVAALDAIEQGLAVQPRQALDFSSRGDWSYRSRVTTLSDEELVALRSLATLATMDAVAQALNCSPRSLHRRLARLYKKLNVGGRQEAVAFTFAMGLVAERRGSQRR